MTVRATMADLILDLRGLTDASTSDYTAGGVTFWTDQQLQDILDGRVVSMHFAELGAIPEYANGVYTYKEYVLPLGNVEGGTALTIMDNVGVAQGTALWSFDRNRGVITFTNDQAAAPRFATGKSYNVNLAAADVWRKKAAHYAVAYDVSTDNHSLKRSQLVAQAKEQMKYFEAMGGASSVTMERGDC